MSLRVVFLIGILIQLFGVGLGQLIGAFWGPYLGATVVIALMSILLFYALKSHEWTQLVIPAICWGFVYVVLFQSLRFYASDILPMGLQPFSEEHLLESSFVILVFACAYVGQLGLLQYIIAKIN